MAHIETVYREWLGYAREGRLEEAQRLLHPTCRDSSVDIAAIGYLNPSARRQKVLEAVDSSSNTVLDAIISDPDDGCLAARSFTEATAVNPAAGLVGVPATGGRFRVFEHELVWFRDGMISRTYTVGGKNADPHHLSSEDLISAITQDPVQTKKLSKADLKLFYRQYIQAINENLAESTLADFVCPNVVHNSKHLSLAQYVSLINDSSSAFDNMTATILTLLANEEAQLIVARIEWSGTLTAPLRGVAPNGRPVRFSEVVFYQLHLGKIAQVWAVVDWDSFEAQMRNTTKSSGP
jgi:predicted ester cyclase